MMDHMTPDEAREQYEAGWRAGRRDAERFGDVKRCVCDLNNQPAVTQDADGHQTVSWPTGKATRCLPVHVELFEEIVADRNKLIAERDELRTRIDKALALHTPWPCTRTDHPIGCQSDLCRCGSKHPCLIRRTLTGGES